MKILTAGDSHCDIEYVGKLFYKAQELECEKIFIVGDFGYWPNYNGGQQFLNLCSQLATTTGIELYWLDGNHEDFWALETHVHKDNFVDIKPGIIYCPRGHSWQWDGVSFMSLGGAYSIEEIEFFDTRLQKTIRMCIRGDSAADGWFEKEEVLSAQDINKARSVGPVDVVFAHDVAVKSDIMNKLPHLTPDVGCDMHREAVGAATEFASPFLFVHGHYHKRYENIVDGTRFVGLAHNKIWNYRQSDCFIVVDTEDFK